MLPRLLDVPELSPAGPASVPAVCGGKRFVEVPGRDQTCLQARSVDDFVPPQAFVRLFDEILEVCDLSALEAYYPGGGRPAYPPQLLCKLVIYAQCVGVRSSREISRRLETDLNFMWLASELRIDHETLSDFRRGFRSQIKDIFKRLVHIAVKLGLARLEHISLDGTKLAACAARKAYDREGLEAVIKRIEEKIEKLMAEAEAADEAEDARLGKLRGDEIPKELLKAKGRRERLLAAQQALEASDQDLISVNDPEALVQKTQDGKRPGYNGQLAVDAENGFIVGENLVCDQNDTAQFMPMAEQAMENAGETPGAFAADSGYQSADTLEKLDKSELNGYINQQPAGKEGRFGHDDFSYDPAADTYTCPEGKALKFRDLKTLHEVEHRRYRAVSICRDCPSRGQCLSPKARYRELLIAPHEALLSAMRRKITTPEGERALQLRGQTVERTFGTMKAQLGLRQFLLRGLAGARAEFTLCALAVNVRKLVQWLREEGSLEQLRRAAKGEQGCASFFASFFAAVIAVFGCWAPLGSLRGGPEPRTGLALCAHPAGLKAA